MGNKIVLVKVEDRKEFHLPFGLLYLASSLKKANFEPYLFHIHKKDITKTVKRIEEINPLLAGFSTLTGQQLNPTLKMSQMVKLLDYPVVWGGVHPSILAEICLKEESVDFVVRGEGEETIVDLATCLKENLREFSKIKGLAYKEDGEIIINQERELLRDLDQYSLPWEMIDLPSYFNPQFGKRRVIPLVTSRGCPFECGFCYNLAFNKSRWRGHSLDFMAEQAYFLKKKYQIEGIIFDDDNLFTRKKRAKEIIEFFGIPWFGEMRADLLDEEITYWLKKSNCQRIFLGIESGSQRILDLIKKNLTLEQIERSISLLAKERVKADLSFIIGFPGEIEEDRGRTFDFIDRLMAIHPQSTASVKIYTPYPGTPLWLEAVKQGFRPPENNQDWAKMGRERCFLPWMDCRRTETISTVAQFALANIEDTFVKGHRLLAPLEKIRWKRRFFGFPIEIKLLRLAREFFSRV